jgi:pimeloyl-ACP methyl ester carboxylesterase
MPYAVIEDGVRLYYELTGPDDGPIVLQFGGGLFGRHNFGLVNDGFRDRGFGLLAFDARGYGASRSPSPPSTRSGRSPPAPTLPSRNPTSTAARCSVSGGG